MCPVRPSTAASGSKVAGRRLPYSIRAPMAQRIDGFGVQCSTWRADNHPTRALLPPPTCYLKPENARQTPELMVTKGTFGRQGTALQFANDHENQGAVRAMRAERAEMRMREVLLFLSVAT